MPQLAERIGMPIWAAAAVIALAVAAAVTDIRGGKVPNWLTYPAVIVALAGHALTGGLSGPGPYFGLGGAAAGLVAGLAPMLVIRLLGGIGGGDAKLMAAFGALGGWRFALSAMLLAFVAGGLMAVVVMIRKRIVVRTLKRILLAVLTAMSGAKADVDGGGQEPSPTVPFAVALAIGAVAAGLATYWGVSPM